MSDKQKKIALIAGAAIAAWLLYSYIRGRQTTATTSTTTDASGTPVDTSASDYAALAGQEQGDVAGLQSQNTQLFGQEQSDVAALQSQEGLDVSTLTAGLSSLTGTVQSLVATVTGQGSSIAELATGTKAGDRTKKKAGPPAVKVKLQKPSSAHPSAPKNTTIAHPNANHTAQTGTHKTLPTGGASVSPKNKPKTSGRRG